MQDTTYEFHYRHVQILKCAKAINSNNLDRKDVSKAYHRSLLAMVTYPMTVTTITAKELSSMQVITDKTHKTKKCT